MFFLFLFLLLNFVKGMARGVPEVPLTPHPHLTIPHLTKIIFTDEQCDSNCNLISVFLFHKTCLSLPKHLFVLLSLLMDSTLYYNHSITILHFNGFIDL